MPVFPSLEGEPTLDMVFRRFPHTVAPLLEYHDRLLRGDSPLSVAERELIAAYVSALNACTFCTGAHRAYAEVFGIAPALIDALIADVATAPVDERLRPLLAYVAKLNTLPSRLVQADARAVYEAGWSEAALYEAVQVCALFNMMNRIIEGTGVNFDYAEAPEGHPATGTTPEDQAATYSRFGAMVEAMAKG